MFKGNEKSRQIRFSILTALKKCIFKIFDLFFLILELTFFHQSKNNEFLSTGMKFDEKTGNLTTAEDSYLKHFFENKIYGIDSTKHLLVSPNLMLTKEGVGNFLEKIYKLWKVKKDIKFVKQICSSRVCGNVIKNANSVNLKLSPEILKFMNIPKNHPDLKRNEKCKYTLNENASIHSKTIAIGGTHYSTPTMMHFMVNKPQINQQLIDIMDKGSPNLDLSNLTREETKKKMNEFLKENAKMMSDLFVDFSKQMLESGSIVQFEICNIMSNLDHFVMLVEMLKLSTSDIIGMENIAELLSIGSLRNPTVDYMKINKSNQDNAIFQSFKNETLDNNYKPSDRRSNKHKRNPQHKQEHNNNNRSHTNSDNNTKLHANSKGNHKPIGVNSDPNNAVGIWG